MNKYVPDIALLKGDGKKRYIAVFDMKYQNSRNSVYAESRRHNSHQLLFYTLLLNVRIILRKALWNRGYRYRKNYKDLPGKPDIVLLKYKIAIFCDGEFFHGKNWEILRPHLEQSNNGEFWIKKISRNIERDDEINKQLLFLGWTVIRFWGDEIKKNTDGCIKVIEEVIFDLAIDDWKTK